MIATAATRHVNAWHDYLALRQEAIELARRILAELATEIEATEDVNWGHVGTMAHYRNELRAISDQLFREGEYAIGGSS